MAAGAVRAALHAITEGWWSPSPRVSLQVINRRTQACVAELDFGRDWKSAEAARLGMIEDLAALPWMSSASRTTSSGAPVRTGVPTSVPFSPLRSPRPPASITGESRYRSGAGLRSLLFGSDTMRPPPASIRPQRDDRFSLVSVDLGRRVRVVAIRSGVSLATATRRCSVLSGPSSTASGN